jgi:hypothetical protein
LPIFLLLSNFHVNIHKESSKGKNLNKKPPRTNSLPKKLEALLLISF